MGLALWSQPEMGGHPVEVAMAQAVCVQHTVASVEVKLHEERLR